jgi:TRAP-type C4-dicarboxylate transport system permease large subunit
VALIHVLELAVCWPLFVAWFIASELALSPLAPVLVAEAGCIVVVVLIGDTVASVGHLMIVKRFEIEMEIKDSQLYASRYNDD